MRTAEGPFPMETTYTWEAVDAATTCMTLRNRGEPTSLAALLGQFMVRMIRHPNRKDLARLKRNLEHA